MKRAAIGISAHMGWAATTVIAIERKRLRVLRTDRIATAEAGDREALEPYHFAGGFDGLARVPRPPDPQKALERGLSKQRRFAARSIEKLTRALADHDYRLARAGLLVGRGRPAPDFEKAIGAHPQIHVQEGLAVRASIAAALAAADVQLREVDQKALVAIADDELASIEPAWSEQLDTATPQNGGAWRKEQKHAAVAAWLALRRIR